MKFYFLSGCCLLMFIYSDVYQYLLMFTGHTATWKLLILFTPRPELVDDASVTAVSGDPLEDLGRYLKEYNIRINNSSFQARRQYSETQSARSSPRSVSSFPACFAATPSARVSLGRVSQTQGFKTLNTATHSAKNCDIGKRPHSFLIWQFFYGYFAVHSNHLQI